MSEGKKKIIYYEYPKTHADLKIRWQYDGLGQTEFYRILSTSYLEKDQRILDIINEYKKENRIQNEVKRKKTQKMYEKKRKTESKFSLEEEERESIFDLLEKEHPDL